MAKKLKKKKIAGTGKEQKRVIGLRAKRKDERFWFCTLAKVCI